MSEQNQHQSEHGQGIPITIDKEHLKAPKTPMTGIELRNLPTPPVPADRDLWLEIPGPHDDELIKPDKSYEIEAGMHFYTAPAAINPGRP